MKTVLRILGLMLFSSWVFAAPVDVNSADAKTIASSLHGIGMKKAEAIVADRAKNGPFKNADDLARVKGIGAKTIAKNKADILIGGASAPTAAGGQVAAPAASTASPTPTTPPPSAPATGTKSISVPAAQ